MELKLGEPVSSKKLTIQGMTKIFDVYRIPIEHLIYNKKNGRIATYVSQFIDEGNEFPMGDNEAFNKIIEDYIEKSNPDALKKTKANIKIMSQTEPAVVLANGVVLDGNRRFTSLRQLSREGAGAEFSYLEAVILANGNYTEKDIKRLELNLQHAVESKVDYNPIDRLVDIYRDLIEEGGTFSPEEYARETQMTLNKVEEEIEIANLMVEYLDYVSQPLKFYIARDQKIDGPIREIYKILKSKNIDLDRIEDIKEFLFLNILSLGGDISRRIREIRSVIEDGKLSTELFNELDESQILEDANDYFEDEKTKELVSSTKVLNLDKGIKTAITQVTENYVESKKLSNAQNQPVEMIKKAQNIIKEIDKDAVERMNSELQATFISIVEKIQSELNGLSG
ncbi:ParB/RepB/Spo0J family partition protein [Lactococcus petauri]|uniref:ParB/RepB/Spo0J family partition protein n=1 Tax=Lactococcus petauri TaxID=1940789 RepID=UPI001BCC5A61|nr:ParB/RepB/Spo0J family partition protein [Lactococcus petauri]